MDPQHERKCEDIRQEGQQLLAQCQSINRALVEKQGEMFSWNSRINEYDRELGATQSAVDTTKAALAAARADFDNHPNDQVKQGFVGTCDARYQEALLTFNGLQQKKSDAVTQRDAIERRHEELAGESTLKASAYQMKSDEFRGLQCEGTFP